MNGDFSLDTNIVIALFANDPAVGDHLKNSSQVLVPSIVIGELCYGARKSGRAEENLARIEEFASRNRILNCDVETARRYAEIIDQLRRKGRPIPENDLWVAAITLQYDLTLATRDTHFRAIVGLKTAIW